MKVAMVNHDEYFGVVGMSARELNDNLAPLAIWTELTGIDDREPNTNIDADNCYIEDWDAYGPHHNGMITRIWWGSDAVEQAEACYDTLVAEGVEPEPECHCEENYRGYHISHRRPGRGSTKPLKYSIYVTEPKGAGLKLCNDIAEAKAAVDAHIKEKENGTNARTRTTAQQTLPRERE